MKKNLVIAILIILIAAGGGVWWFYFGRGGEEKGFIGKIADALKIGTAMKCTYSEGDTTVTFYIKGGKLRGSMGIGDDKVDYIIRDNCQYYWSEKEDEGDKLCWEPTEAPNWEESLPATERYNCQPQTISDSMFNPPSGINFTDMSKEMQQYMPTE